MGATEFDKPLDHDLDELNSNMPKVFRSPSYTVVSSINNGAEKTVNITEDGWYIARAVNTGTSGSCGVGIWADWSRTQLVCCNYNPPGTYTRATVGPIPLKAGTAIVCYANFTDFGDVIKLNT